MVPSFFAIWSFRAVMSPTLPDLSCWWYASCVEGSHCFVCGISNITCWFSLFVPAFMVTPFDVEEFKTWPVCIRGGDHILLPFLVCLMSQSKMSNLKIIPDEESAAVWKQWLTFIVIYWHFTKDVWSITISHTSGSCKRSFLFKCF